MVTDALLAPLLYVVTGAVNLLPSGAPLKLPSMGGFWDVVGGLDSMLPVLAVLNVALGLLAAVVVFMAVRLVLLVWNLVWP